jgi:hypothetical protein
MQSPALPSKSRPGCLMRLVYFVLLASITVLAITAVFAPWGFFMGGRFHLIPMWQGWARLHSTMAGGDYALFVRFSPRSARGGGPHVFGSGLLCTPRGEKFSLNVGGDFQRGYGINLQGRTAYLYMDNSSVTGRALGRSPRPELELRGKWNNPDLVLDDHGSIARNFEPDATLYTGHSPTRPYMREVVPVTLHEGSRSDFDAACKAVKTR